MFPAVILGAASFLVLALSALQLMVARTVDYLNPGRWLSLVDNPSQFYGTVGATVIVGLALGILSTVAVQVRLSRELREASGMPSGGAARRPFRPEL